MSRDLSPHRLFFLLQLYLLLAHPANCSKFLDLNALQTFDTAWSADNPSLFPSSVSATDRRSNEHEGQSLNPAYAARAIISHSFEKTSFRTRLDNLQDRDDGLDDLRLDLSKRYGVCPGRYGSCSDLGTPSLCCPYTAVCSADYNGQVACCPIGAVCTGVVGGQQPMTRPPATTTVRTGQPATTTGGFVISGGATITIGAGGSGAIARKPPSLFSAIAESFRVLAAI